MPGVKAGKGSGKERRKKELLLMMVSDMYDKGNERIEGHTDRTIDQL